MYNFLKKGSECANLFTSYINYMTQAFYKLTHEEWIRSQQLKPAERDLLFYLKTKDPFCDGIEITVTQIAEDLGRNKSTISRALKILTEQGWIDLEMVKVKIKVLRGDNSVAYRQHAIPVGNMSDRHATHDSPTQHAIPVGNNRGSKPPDIKASEVSKTNTDYKDYLDSLRPETRESFEKFCKIKIDQSGFKIASRTAWLNKHYEEYWEEFKTLYQPQKSEVIINTSPILKEKIKAAIASGQIKIERNYINGRFVDGVRDREKGWFDTVEAWDNASN